MDKTSNISDKKLVAIQGGYGAFHEIAARKFFSQEEIDVQPVDTFDQITDELSTKELTYGMMAIENTVAGSLVPNYALLREAPIKIVGEVYLRIKHNLVALPGQKIEDITEVHSHYMAIAQCRKYFKQNYPEIKLVESVDTALSARKIQDEKLIGKGAISSELAADLYDLEILAPSIETNKRNYTRFLVLTHQDNEGNCVQDCNKTSLYFSLPHHKGSLSQVLSVLSFYDMDLTKIQSMPIIGKEFRYFFYVDMIFEDYSRYQQAITAISPLVVDLKVYGEYIHAIESLEDIHNQ